MSLDRENQADRATFIGIVGALGLVFLAIYLGEGALTFLDLKSFLIVVGGTLGSTLVTFPLDDFMKAFTVLRTAFYPDTESEHYRIRRILDLSQQARTNGLLSLQSEAYREVDPFFRKAIELVVDGLPPDDVRRILDTEMIYLDDRHRRGAALFQTMGTTAPAMGLLATVIGLIQMLRNLDNAASIGPSMAVALTATFYGAVLAYLLFLPLAGKLRTRSEEEMNLKEMTMEGMISVAKGLSPHILEEYLLSFLPPGHRVARFT